MLLSSCRLGCYRQNCVTTFWICSSTCAIYGHNSRRHVVPFNTLLKLSKNRFSLCWIPAYALIILNVISYQLAKTSILNEFEMSLFPFALCGFLDSSGILMHPQVYFVKSRKKYLRCRLVLWSKESYHVVVIETFCLMTVCQIICTVVGSSYVP